MNFLDENPCGNGNFLMAVEGSDGINVELTHVNIKLLYLKSLFYFYRVLMFSF